MEQGRIKSLRMSKEPRIPFAPGRRAQCLVRGLEWILHWKDSVSPWVLSHLGLIILCCGDHLLHCWMVSSISGLYPVARSTPPPGHGSWQQEMPADFAKCSHGREVVGEGWEWTLVEDTGSELCVLGKLLNLSEPSSTLGWRQQNAARIIWNKTDFGGYYFSR